MSIVPYTTTHKRIVDIWESYHGIDVVEGEYLYIYMYVCIFITPQKRLWQTSCLIYRLAVPLCTQLNKSRISLFNIHLTLFVWRMTQLRLHLPIGKYHHLANWLWNSPWKSTNLAVGRLDKSQAESLQHWERVWVWGAKQHQY